jgi:hypothetical protein
MEDLMGQAIAYILGSLIGAALDPMVLIPALAVGAICRSWRQFWWALLIAWGAVFIVKAQAIRDVAERMMLGDPPMWKYAIIYALVMAMISLFTVALRRAASGRWIGSEY